MPDLACQGGKDALTSKIGQEGAVYRGQGVGLASPASGSARLQASAPPTRAWLWVWQPGSRKGIRLRRTKHPGFASDEASWLRFGHCTWLRFGRASALAR